MYGPWPVVPIAIFSVRALGLVSNCFMSEVNDGFADNNCGDVANSPTGAKSFCASKRGFAYAIVLIVMAGSATISVYPSGVALATSSLPIMLEAPGRLSITNV